MFTSEEEVTQSKKSITSNKVKLNILGGYGLGRGMLSDDSHGPGDREQVNHYEKGIMLNKRGNFPSDIATTTGANTVYHMGTLSRASKNSQNSDKNQQVVDSAYGTTRSVKKVYL